NLPLSTDISVIDGPSKADLKVTKIYTMPRYPLVGDTVVFLALVKNMGNRTIQAGEKVEVDFYVNDQKVSMYSYPLLPIEPGGAALVCANTAVDGRLSWDASAEGRFPVKAVVDPGGLIDEWKEDNNEITDTLVVYAQPPENLAYLKPVTVSSVEGPGLEGDKAVDGNFGTRWSSQFSEPQYLQIDLQKVTTFNRIRITWETAYAKNYQIAVSSDSINWRIYTVNPSGDGGVDEFVKTDSARYIKINCLQRATQWGCPIYEVEVYNDPATSIEKEESLSETFRLLPVYPNPFNPSFTYEIELNRVADLQINIFNIQGQKILSRKWQHLPLGTFRHRFDMEKFPAG
ncbi:MAG: hypothetical protein D6732_07165, partial [Methanobacteriota archaeon]